MSHEDSLTRRKFGKDEIVTEHPVDPPDSLPQNHLGTAFYTSFYLFFSATFLFTMAGMLLSSGVWSFLVRLPMIHLAYEPSRIVVVFSGYVFAAGALTLPASCILYREHNMTSNRRTLLPVRLFIIIVNRSDCTTVMQLNNVFQRT